MKVTEPKALEKIANKIRIDIIQEIYYGKSGHPGGSLSCADILAVLYFNEMNIDPNKPQDENRDRFVLSKGHASSALYATLAERGYFPKEELISFRNVMSRLQGHPDMTKLPGIDATTGSLGQGLSIANGMALNSKMNSMGYRVYCLIGDGELEEGQIWEACMTASKYKLDNLCAIIDCNGIQLSSSVQDTKGLTFDDIESKFRSFGFSTQVIDGNNVASILEALQVAEKTKGKPTAIIAKTIKGKGVSFMENDVKWHGKAPNDDEVKQAMEELTKSDDAKFFEAKIK